MTGSSQFGSYRLLRPLGKGSFGAVYEALQLPLSKRVALKVMHAHIAEQSAPVARFRREAQALVQLRHPHVVDVLDLGELEGRPFLAMEFLEGETLSQRVARFAPMPLAMVGDLLAPVCAAVAAAHDLGIIHRDLKPDNIFIAHSLGGDHPKLLDFGIAKLAVPEADFAGTATSAILGTPYYMSPEQIQSTRSVGPPADVWSLGVIAWECLTGSKLFKGATLFELFQQVVGLVIPPIRALRADVPEGLAQALASCFERDPARRLAGARLLGAALLEIASDRTRALLGTSLHAAPVSVVATGPASSPGATLAVTSPPAAPLLGTEQASTAELPLRAVAPSSPRHRRLVTAALALGLVGALGGSTLLLRDDPPPAGDAASPPLARPGASGAERPAEVHAQGLSEAERRQPVTPRVLVAMEAAPAQAVFILDGVRVGTGRVRVEVSAAVTHVLRVEAPGHVAQSLTFREIPPPTRIELEAVPAPTPLPVLPRPSRDLRRPRPDPRFDGLHLPSGPLSSEPIAPLPPPTPSPTPPGAPSRSGTLSNGEF